MTGHFTDAAIEGYVRGTLDDDARSSFEAHAAECPTCAQAMADLRLRAGSAGSRAAPPADAPAAAASAAAARMRWYALAASIVLALSLPLGYWWQSTHGEPAGLRGLASLAPGVQARVREAIRSGEIALPADIAALAGQPETLMGAATTPPFHLVTRSRWAWFRTGRCWRGSRSPAPIATSSRSRTIRAAPSSAASRSAGRP